MPEFRSPCKLLCVPQHPCFKIALVIFLWSSNFLQKLSFLSKLSKVQCLQDIIQCNLLSCFTPDTEKLSDSYSWFLFYHNLYYIFLVLTEVLINRNIVTGTYFIMYLLYIWVSALEASARIMEIMKHSMNNYKIIFALEKPLFFLLKETLKGVLMFYFILI